VHRSLLDVPRLTRALSPAAALRRVVMSPAFVFLVATAAAFVIFFARGPAAYLHPILYGEDALWASMIYRHGFWLTLLHARGDYHVLGNILALGMGIQACELFCAGNILALPRCYAMISYLFFAVTVSLPLLLLRGQLRPFHLLAVWLLGCFLPIGTSGTEILGRLCNIGYAFVYIGFVLVWYRNCVAKTRLAFMLTDFGLLACVATNPICFVLLPATAWPFVVQWVRKRRPVAEVIRSPAMISLMALAVCSAVVLAKPLTNKQRANGSISLTPAVAVEMGIARNALFPLVWPIYEHLTTGGSLLAAAAVLGCMARVSTKKHRLVFVGGVGLLAITSIVLVVMRPDLGSTVADYHCTYPDRYYYGHNLVAMLLLVMLAADAAVRLRGSRQWRRLPDAVLAGFVVACIARQGVLGVSQDQFQHTEIGTFAECVQTALNQRRYVTAAGTRHPKGKYLLIDTYPCFADGTGWQMTLPRGIVDRLLTSGHLVASWRPEP
jgi:hypothetical protein